LNRKLLLFRFSMMAITVTLALLSLEVIARVLAPEWLTQMMRLAGAQAFGTDQGWKADKKDRKNGHFWRFTAHGEFDVTDDEYSNRVHIDEYGGRVTAVAESAENTDFVPFLGDSFTFGLGVADAETFASLLSPVVSPRRILNLGVPDTALND